MPTFPQPVNPVSTSWPDVISAVQAFLFKYAVPALPLDNVICGNFNRAALPNTDELTIYSFLRHERHGTNVETFDAAAVAEDQDGALETSTLIEAVLQIDFYSRTDAARQRAQTVETIAKSSSAVQFFKPYGISCLYASDIRDMTGMMDAEQYVQRYMLELHLSFWSTVSQGLPWFDAVDVDLKNVDVVCPPLE